MSTDPSPDSVRGHGPRLRLETGTSEPLTVELETGPNLLGRSESNDIQLDHPTVSETHCRIELTAAGIQVEDLGSTNGTFIDDEPVQQAVLKPGQTLRLGDVQLVLELPVLEPVELIPPLSPPGAIACVHHLDTRATWICTECQRSLCAACVKQVRLPEIGPVTLCRSCDGLCERAGKAKASEPERGFGGGMIAALGYPLRGASLALLLAGALLNAAVGVSGRFFLVGGLAVFGGLLLGGYVVAFLRQVLLSSADGQMTPPGWPEFDGPTLAEAAFQFIVPWLVSFGPWTFCSIWLRPETAETKWLCEALLVLGAGYFPMALLAVLIYDNLSALNPLIVIVSIARTLGRYIALLLFLAPIVGLALWLHTSGARASSVLAGFVELYATVLLMRVLGWFYFCSKDQLAWA